MLLRDLDQVNSAIQQFLTAARRPAVLEPGDERIVLGRDNYALDRRAGRLTLEVWDQRHNLMRRITGIQMQKPGTLELAIERFGQRQGTLMLVDLARPSSIPPERLGARLRYRERFRRSLLRQFPSWTIAELSTEANLEHSLSPAYPRALLRKGAAAWAAIGAPAVETADGALAFGLIWLDHVRTRERKLAVEGLALFLPVGGERPTCLRLAWLDHAIARYAVFACMDDDGLEERVDPADRGNLDTRLEPRTSLPQSSASELAHRLVRETGADAVERGDGALSIRIRGVEFARADAGGLKFGIDSKRPAGESHWPELVALAARLKRMRSHEAVDHANPLVMRSPELWLESQVRANLETIDATLLPSPIYGQVPAFTGGDRGIIDLLAADRAGRLAVIELKATQDLHLPLQALDYWIRVRHHAASGDFSRCGYFPGMALTPQSPRLLLVAPALEFHPTTERLLRFLDPRIDVVRAGLAMDWRRKPAVVFRATGAERPGMR